MVLPPAQNAVAPVIAGVNAPTPTLALPFVLQPPSDAVTLIVIGDEEAEKVIDGVP